MKILILTTYHRPVNSVTDPEFSKESTGKIFSYLAQKHEVDLALFNQVSINISSQGVKLSLKGQDLRVYDRIVLRAITCGEIDNGWLAKVVSLYAKKHQIKTVNAEHFIKHGYIWDKMYQNYLFASNSFPLPQTYFGNVKEADLPLIAKPLLGSHGKGIFLLDSLDKLAPKGEFFYQELLPNRQDYRLIVLGGKVLGAMLRKATGDSLVSNITAGGEALLAQVDTEAEKLALKLAQVCNFDFCGVDLMKDKQGKYRVLEVNRNPEFNGFQRATKVNVPAQLEKFLLLE